MIMNELLTATWREQVPALVAAEADEWQGKITVAVNAAVVTAGQALRAMKAQMPHGCFEQWWRGELKLKDSKMVSDLMAASEVLECQPEVTPLSDLPARTLGILNRGGPEAVTKAVKRLAQGERITEAKAREIVKPEGFGKSGDSPETGDPWTPDDRRFKTADDLVNRLSEIREVESKILEVCDTTREMVQQQPKAGAIPISDWDEVAAFERFKDLTQDGIAHMVNGCLDSLIVEGRLPEESGHEPAPTNHPAHEHLEELWRARLAIGNWMGDEQGGPTARICIGGIWFDATPSQMQGGPEAMDV